MHSKFVTGHTGPLDISHPPHLCLQIMLIPGVEMSEMTSWAPECSLRPQNLAKLAGLYVNGAYNFGLISTMVFVTI